MENKLEKITFYGVMFFLLIYFELNPMTSIITAYREILFYARVPGVLTFVQAGLLSLILLIVGWFSFCKLEKRFSEAL